MNIDLTRHGGYQLTWSEGGIILLVSIVLLCAISVGVLSYYDNKKEGDHSNLMAFIFGGLLGGFASTIFIAAPILMMARSLPVFQGMRGVHSQPRSTNFFQESRKVPETHLSYMTLPGTTAKSDEQLAKSDYSRAIISQVEKYYNVKVISMEQKYIGTTGNESELSMLVQEGTHANKGKVEDCKLRAMNVKRQGEDASGPVKSFTGYLLCSGSEAPRR